MDSTRNLMNDVTGVLLAGGKSRRMGLDKRFLKLDGETLLRRALSVYERLFPEILVVVAEPVPELVDIGHQIVTDLIPNCATLGGLYTGLSVASSPRIFAAACDMPFFESFGNRFLRKDGNPCASGDHHNPQSNGRKEDYLTYKPKLPHRCTPSPNIIMSCGISPKFLDNIQCANIQIARLSKSRRSSDAAPMVASRKPTGILPEANRFHP